MNFNSTRQPRLVLQFIVYLPINSNIDLSIIGFWEIKTYPQKPLPFTHFSTLKKEREKKRKKKKYINIKGFGHISKSKGESNSYQPSLSQIKAHLISFLFCFSILFQKLAFFFQTFFLIETKEQCMVCICRNSVFGTKTEEQLLEQNQFLAHFFVLWETFFLNRNKRTLFIIFCSNNPWSV